MQVLVSEDTLVSNADFDEFKSIYEHIMGRHSSVGIATRYGLDGPGIESRWGQDFSAPVQTGPGAHSVSYTMGTGYLYGGKAAGRGADHPPPSSAVVEGRVELYICSPSEHSRPDKIYMLKVLKIRVLAWDLALKFDSINRCNNHQPSLYNYRMAATQFFYYCCLRAVRQ